MATAHVLFVGAGWVVENCWLPACAEVGIGAVTLYDSNLARAEECLAAASALSLSAAIAETSAVQADVAVIATPAGVRVSTASSVLGNVGRVVLEKPAALKVDHLNELIGAAAPLGVDITVVDTVAYRPDVTAFVEAAKAHTPELVDLRWVRRGGIPRRPTFLDPALSGGGSLLDLGWHLLDVLDAIDPTMLDGASVESVEWNRTTDESTDLGWQPSASGASAGAVDTGACMRARATSGVPFVVETSWVGADGTDRTELSVAGADGVSTVRLECTFGFSPNRPRDAVLTAVAADGDRHVRFFENTSRDTFKNQADRLFDRAWVSEGSVHDVRRALPKIALFESAYNARCLR